MKIDRRIHSYSMVAVLEEAEFFLQIFVVLLNRKSLQVQEKSGSRALRFQVLSHEALCYWMLL